MTLRTRRLLFTALSLIFICIGTGIVFYSNGSRFDFSTFSLTGTGGIYLRTNPTDTLLSLDGLPIQNESGLLKRGTLIANLPEASYSVSVSKEGYHDWSKNIPVEASLVTSYDSIILISHSLPTLVDSELHNFHLFEGELILEKNSRLYFGDVVLRGNEILKINGGNLITRNSLTGDIYLYHSSNLGSALNATFLFLQLKQSQLGLPGIVFVEDVDFSPTNADELIIKTTQALYVLNTEELILYQVAKDISSFSVAPLGIYWTSEVGTYFYNFQSQINDALKEIPLIYGEPISVTSSSSGDFALLSYIDGKLLLLDYQENNVLTLTENVGDVYSFSPNSRLALYLNEDLGKLFAFDTLRQRSLPLSLDGVPSIDEITWHRSGSYVFIKSGESLFFVEIDENDPLNVIRIADSVSAYVYDPDTDEVYISQPNGIYKKAINNE